MKKLSIYLGLALLTFAFSLNASAQLSDRINNPSTFKIGTRPVAGNFAFYLGLDTDNIDEIFDDSVDVQTATPLINVRYYKKDDLVLRAGLMVWKKNRSLQGEIDTTSASLANPYSFAGQGVGSYYEHKEMEAWALVHLGIEKHFKTDNMIDGYVGASLPFGYSRGSEYTSKGTDYSKDYFKSTASRFSIIYGLEMFVGFNAFIADLPLSIGTELGIKSMGVTSNQYKHEYEGSAGGISYSGTYYTNNIDDFEDNAAQITADELRFSSLKTKEWDTQALVRFTISYYFK